MSTENIFNAIASTISVTVDSVTPTVRNFADLPTGLDTADLPARLLLPFEGRDAETGDFSFVALGPTAQSTRRISDLLLWAPVNQGVFPEVTDKLVRYVDAYESVMRLNRSLGLAQASVKGVRSNVGLFEWPLGSGMVFRGVEVMLEVQEMLSG